MPASREGDAQAAGTSATRHAQRRHLAVGPGRVVQGLLVAACLDPAGAARDTCRSEGVSERRCRAIVDGSAEEIPVFCRPRLADTAASIETAP